MTTIDIHEAKTHLSLLDDRAAKGESIVIARAGRPVARLVALDTQSAADRRLGFLRGAVPYPGRLRRDGVGSDRRLFLGC